MCVCALDSALYGTSPPSHKLGFSRSGHNGLPYCFNTVFEDSFIQLSRAQSFLLWISLSLGWQLPALWWSYYHLHPSSLQPIPSEVRQWVSVSPPLILLYPFASLQGSLAENESVRPFLCHPRPEESDAWSAGWEAPLKSVLRSSFWKALMRGESSWWP